MACNLNHLKLKPTISRTASWHHHCLTRQKKHIQIVISLCQHRKQNRCDVIYCCLGTCGPIGSIDCCAQWYHYLSTGRAVTLAHASTNTLYLTFAAPMHLHTLELPHIQLLRLGAGTTEGASCQPEERRIIISKLSVYRCLRSGMHATNQYLLHQR